MGASCSICPTDKRRPGVGAAAYSVVSKPHLLSSHRFHLHPIFSRAPPPGHTQKNSHATQDRFESGGGGGAEAFAKPTNRSFSRRSMLQAREESIALGHSMKFKDVVKDGQTGSNNNSSSSIGSSGVRGNNSSLSGTGTSRRPSGLSDSQEVDEVAPDAHMFLSRHSWGSASSARRRHNAVVRGGGGGVVSARVCYTFERNTAIHHVAWLRS